MSKKIPLAKAADKPGPLPLSKSRYEGLTDHSTATRRAGSGPSLLASQEICPERSRASVWEVQEGKALLGLAERSEAAPLLVETQISDSWEGSNYIP
jgi:hypothetical protein